MTTAVYQITNRINQKVYFGKASNPTNRWYKHCWEAQRGKDYPLHRALRKYGPSAFSFEILAVYATNAEACDHEIRLIASVAPSQRYNIAKGGDGGPTMTSSQLAAQYAIKPESYAAFVRSFQEGASIPELTARFGVSINAVNSCATRLGLSFVERNQERILKKQAQRRLAREKHQQALERWAQEKRRRDQEVKEAKLRTAQEKRQRDQEVKEAKLATAQEKRQRDQRTRYEPVCRTIRGQFCSYIKPRITAKKRYYPSTATLTPEERSVRQAEVARRTNKARGCPKEVQAKALQLYFEEHWSAAEVAQELKISKGAVRGAVNRAYALMSDSERAIKKKVHGSAARTGSRNPRYRARRPPA